MYTIPLHLILLESYFQMLREDIKNEISWFKVYCNNFGNACYELPFLIGHVIKFTTYKVSKPVLLPLISGYRIVFGMY